MEARLHRFWETIREYVTHWSVTGLILAATGAAPEHWLAELFREVHFFPLDLLPEWIERLDYRLLAVVIGLSIIVGDNLWRHHHASPDKAADLSKSSRDEERLSIAVLPFDNMSGDPAQEYFSDGITGEIITALARVRWFFVIARNSSFTYKGKATDIKQIGRELCVRYVLEGSVRLSNQHIKISAQLIEAQTGTHVWADRYDGVLNDLFELQDKVTESVVFAIEPTLRTAELARTKRNRPGSLTAYDLTRCVSLSRIGASFRLPSDGNRQKAMTLDGGEFIRRFLIHVLPDGFHRIRYFGFLGNCQRARKLALCRALLGVAPPGPADPPLDYRDRFHALTGRSWRECPHCRTGVMVVIDSIARFTICQPVLDTS